MIFQEIWDFRLEFKDWKCSDLMGGGGQDFNINPKLELVLNL